MELKAKYDTEVKPHMMKTFNYKSVMQVPKITKIVVNMTAGKDVTNAKAVDEVMQQLALITGQKPFKLTAKKSLAAFKLRAGMHVGGKVTIRGNHMWNFLKKLITINIPRVRDFRGISPKQFDGRGNFSMGIPEQIIFPEIHYDKIAKVHGLDVMIITTSNKDEEALELLRKLGMPFRKQKGDVRG